MLNFLTETTGRLVTAERLPDVRFLLSSDGGWRSDTDVIRREPQLPGRKASKIKNNEASSVV